MIKNLKTGVLYFYLFGSGLLFTCLAFKKTPRELITYLFTLF